MKILCCVLSLLAISTPLFAETSQAEQPTVTTLCQIKAHPEQFEHKLVEFTAIASHGFEDSMVEDAACKWNTGDNPGVWMDYGGTAKTDTMYCCGPTIGKTRPKPLVIDGIEISLVEDALFQQFNARLHPLHEPRRGSDTVRATLRGRIFARKEVFERGTLWGGYGHMGCCVLFVVAQVVAVDARHLKPE